MHIYLYIHWMAKRSRNWSIESLEVDWDNPHSIAYNLRFAACYSSKLDEVKLRLEMALRMLRELPNNYHHHCQDPEQTKKHFLVCVEFIKSNHLGALRYICNPGEEIRAIARELRQSADFGDKYNAYLDALINPDSKAEYGPLLKSFNEQIDRQVKRVANITAPVFEF